MPSVGHPYNVYRNDHDGPLPDVPVQAETTITSGLDVKKVYRSANSPKWSGTRNNIPPGVVFHAYRRNFDFSKSVPQQGYRKALSLPNSLEDGEKLAAFSWGKEGDTRNGTAVLRIEDFTICAPEFRGFSTLLALRDPADGMPNVRVTGVLPLRSSPPSVQLQTYGGVLLNRIIGGDEDPEFMLMLANYASQRVAEDPLVALALSYVFDACSKRDEIRKLFLSLAKNEDFEIAMDIPLLAGLPIDYDNSKRILSCKGRPLATQMPILSRGWSRLFHNEKNGIFDELSDLRSAISVHGYAMFRQMKHHDLLVQWLHKYFENNTKPKLK